MNEAIGQWTRKGSGAFTSWRDYAREELALRAIKDVLDLHSPWQRWEQVFHPRYVGERYLGPGCRMCGPSPAADCMTVKTIAARFGLGEYT